MIELFLKEHFCEKKHRLCLYGFTITMNAAMFSLISSRLLCTGGGGVSGEVYY